MVHSGIKYHIQKSPVVLTQELPTTNVHPCKVGDVVENMTLIADGPSMENGEMAFGTKPNRCLHDMEVAVLRMRLS